MAAPRKTFSEHWHTVAGQRLWLLPTVRAGRQDFEGGRWHVLEDPMRGNFFRLHPAAYAFVARLSPDRTVEEAWDSVLRAHPESAPTQGEVLELLGQMQSAGLLRGDLPADSRRLLDRNQKARGRQLRSQFTNLSSFKIPLLNPDAILERLAPLGRLVFSWPGAVLWVLIVGTGAKVAVENWSALSSHCAGALDPANLPYLAVVFTLVKVIHELGHGLACRRFGGPVRETGVMFMFLAPFPYVDTTSSWAFRERSKRILVAAAGMVFELFVAALAVMVWSRTGDQGLKGLTYNIVFVASVTTVLFNGNPLLRYDAYYILSDLIRVPNLQQRSNQMLGFLSERYLFAMGQAVTPAMSRREAWILAAYGIGSNAYRLVLFAKLAFWVAGEYLILGLLMAAGAVYGLFVKPVVSLLRYLASSPRLGRHRARAVLVTAAAVAGLLGGLWWVPAPRAFRAPGVLESAGRADLHTGVAGVLKRVVAASGSWVEAGQVLAEFENPELQWRQQAASARREEVLARWRNAEDQGDVDVASFKAALAAADRESEILDARQAGLVVRAPIAGAWEAPDLEHHIGRWMAQGEQVGSVLGGSGFVFRAVVSQEDAAHFFSHGHSRAGVRLEGEACRLIPVSGWRLVPAYRSELPSKALGWETGGRVESKTDRDGHMKAAQPFFEVRADLVLAGGRSPLNGRSGLIRFRVADQPWLRQWLTDFRRFLQKRYRL